MKAARAGQELQGEGHERYDNRFKSVAGETSK